MSRPVPDLPRPPDAPRAAASSPPPTVFGREPVLYLALVKAALVLVVAFGLDLGLEQTAAIVLLAEATLAFLARSQVTPIEAPRLPTVAPARPLVSVRHRDESDRRGPA